MNNTYRDDKKDTALDKCRDHGKDIFAFLNILLMGKVIVFLSFFKLLTTFLPNSIKTCCFYLHKIETCQTFQTLNNTQIQIRQIRF